MNKEQKILYMYDELGKIDDKYVNEALLCEKKAVRQVKFSRLLAVAACIALISVMLTLTIANFPADDSEAPNAPNDNFKESEDYLMNSLEGINIELLSSFKVSENDDSSENLENNASILYDGSVRLIWTYGNGVFYSVTVSDSYDLQSLEDYLANDKTHDFERNSN